MTREQLLEALRALKERSERQDIEQLHMDADDALLAFIADPEVDAAFRAIDKWYS